MLAGLWTGEQFSYQGSHFTVDPVRFRPPPVQQPRIPVWVGGVLPADGPVRRACRWDGMVPLRGSVRPDGQPALAGPTPADIAAVRDQAWSSRGTPEGFDLVVWADLEQEPGDVDLVAPAYTAAGATWWIETAHAGPGGQAEAARRVSRGL